jgi:hypothetical protein
MIALQGHRRLRVGTRKALHHAGDVNTLTQNSFAQVGNFRRGGAMCHCSSPKMRRTDAGQTPDVALIGELKS